MHLAYLRRTIAGKDEESLKEQQASELKRLSVKSKHQICAKAGVRKKSALNKYRTLACFGLTWGQILWIVIFSPSLNLLIYHLGYIDVLMNL